MSSITLNGITWDHPRGLNPLVAAAKEYAKLHDIDIRWHVRSLKDFGDQSLPGLAKRYDLMINDHPHSGVAAKSQCLQPLEKWLSATQLNALQAQSAGPSYHSYFYQNHQWALPVDCAFQSACYRPDLLTTTPPSDWQQVFSLAASLATENKYVAMALCPTDCLCSFLSLSAQLGSPITEGQANLIDSQTGQQVLNLMKRLKHALHPDCLDWNPINLYDHMAEENDVVYSPMAFNYTNYSRDEYATHPLHFTDSPELKTVLGGAGIAVSAFSQYPQQAADFAYWLCTADVQSGLYTQNQGQPGNLAAWQDVNANRLTQDFFNNTRASLEHAYVRPRYAGWPAFQEQLGEVVHECLRLDSDNKQTLTTLEHLYHLSYQE